MDFDAQEVKVYETLGESSDESELEKETEHEREEIETQPVAHAAALHHFVEPATRANEPIEDKIARIRLEIEEIKRSGAHTESKSLLEELNDAVQAKPLAVITNKDSSAEEVGPEKYKQPDILKDEEFVKLESRIASLESAIGSHQGYSRKTLAATLTEIREVIELLSSDPQEIDRRISKLRELQFTSSQGEVTYEEQVNWLYSRLVRMEDELHAIPHITRRLQTLKRVHINAINSAETVQELSKSLASMQHDILEWRKLIPVLESKIENYISLSNKNVSKLSM